MSAIDPTKRSISESFIPQVLEIDEERKNILEDEHENTAQEHLLDLLEHLDPSETIIRDTRGFVGDLDFSILDKCNFKGIITIELLPSKVTSITGLPSGVKKLVFADNYLIDMPDLPDSVIDINIENNFLRILGSLPAGLKELNISNNQIETLENLPASLEVLICDNNKLRVLNLAGIENLRVLKCSGNPHLIIEALPDTLVEFQMDNDVGTQIQKVSSTHVDPDFLTTKANYTECLYTYFELKKKYNDGVLKMKRATYATAKSKKEARVKLADLKPKCIECTRPVGTIFKNEGRNYIARCGDSKNPCSLDIMLFAGEYSEISDMLGYYQRLSELIKQQIMVDKLNVLFHYISEKDGVDIFKENLDFYTKENIHLVALKKEYEDLYFNEDRRDKIGLKLKKIKDIQERISELLTKSALDQGIVADAMTIYVEELIPEMENLQLMKYDTREVIVEDKRIELYQTPWRIQDIEYTFGEFPRVIKYSMKNKK